MNNSSRVVDDVNTNGSASKFLTLCLLWVLIVVGNSLVIGVHRIYQRKQIPDYLIQTLAVLDLLNAFGPVTISIAMYKAHPDGFFDISIKPLCYFYSSAATMLRLSACFVMTVMATDRAISVNMPVYYRAVLQMKTVQRWVALLVVVAFVIACLPLLGASRIMPYRTLCSFDFGSPYAAFIVIIGYLQLVTVLVAYIVVLKGLIGFVERQMAHRENRDLDARTMTRIELADRRKSSSSLAIKEIRSFKLCKEFAKITGIVALLFYVSWIPIVLSITVQLKTGKNSEMLQLLSARMSMTGSIGNPIVYALFSAKYRKGYWYCIQKIACLCGASRLTSNSTESGVSSAFKRKQEVTSQLPYYITGQKQQSPRIPLEPRGVNSRKQCTEMSVTCEKSCQRDCVTFESNAAKYSGNAAKYSGNAAKYSGNAATHSGNAAADDSSDDDIAKQRVIVAIEMQTGFDGDTEDSDNCASESQPANRPLHLEMNESLSVPVGTRIKRRRLKRRAQSEEIISNLKEVKLVNKSKYLDVPKRLIDWDCRAEIDADTDSTDLEQDAASVFNGNITIQIVPVRKDAKQQIHCESA